MESKVKSTFKILDLDIECRPLSFLGSDFMTKEITAIACKFLGEKKVHCWALGESTMPEILEGFLEQYNKAGLVTGHYVTMFDLPLINFTLSEYGYRHLESKLVTDTKTDLLKMSGNSKSQESLAGMFGLEAPKIQMDQTKWREANRLTPEGIKLTKERVIGDVIQHEQLRLKLLELGLLKKPKMWNGQATVNVSYVP